MPQMPTIDSFDAAELEFLDVCPWCRSTSFRTLFHERGFSYVECEHCTLIFLQPRVKEEFISRLYDGDAYHVDTNIAYTRRVGERRLHLLGRLAPQARVFEDGAGMGAFVAACQQQGLEAGGCDLGQDAVQKAKRLFGVDLHHGTLETAGVAEGSLDVLAGFNLLSHLYHPWDYMQHASRLLKPGGRWFIRTGDRSGVMKHVRRGNWSAPEHTFHYNRRLLGEMADAANLKITQVIPAFDSDFPYFLFDYSRPQTSVTRQLAAYACSYSILFWNMFKLPKDDVYIVMRRID